MIVLILGSVDFSAPELAARLVDALPKDDAILVGGWIDKGGYPRPTGGPCRAAFRRACETRRTAMVAIVQDRDLGRDQLIAVADRVFVFTRSAGSVTSQAARDSGKWVRVFADGDAVTAQVEREIEHERERQLEP